MIRYSIITPLIRPALEQCSKCVDRTRRNSSAWLQAERTASNNRRFTRGNNMLGKIQSIRSAFDKTIIIVLKVNRYVVIAFATFVPTFCVVYYAALWWHSSKCLSTSNFLCDAAFVIACYWHIALLVGLSSTVLFAIGLAIYRSFRS